MLYCTVLQVWDHAASVRLLAERDTDTSLALTLVRGDTGAGAGCRVALDTAGVVDIVQ